MLTDTFTDGPRSGIVGSYGSTSICMFLLTSHKRRMGLNGRLLVPSFRMTFLGTSAIRHLTIISMGLMYPLLSVCQTLHRRESPDAEFTFHVITELPSHLCVPDRGPSTQATIFIKLSGAPEEEVLMRTAKRASSH